MVTICGLILSLCLVRAMRASSEMSPSVNCSSAEAFDPHSQKCHKVTDWGTDGAVGKGPCGEKKIFVSSDGDDKVGECICGRPTQKCSRPLVLWADNNTCYELFQQGPCSHGEWLVYNPESGKPSECAKNICIGAPLPGIATTLEPRYHGEAFHFAYKGKCYVSETEAFCPEGKVARFVYNNWNPTCYQPDARVCGAWQYKPTQNY